MNANDVLKYGHLAIMHSIKDVPDEEWNTPNVCGIWSVKDIIGHLASFEHMFADVLGKVLGSDQPTPTMERYLGSNFNDVEAAKRKKWSQADVLHEYEAAQAGNMDLIARIPVDDRRIAGFLPAYGPEYDLEDFIAYAFYGHKREHMSQINVFKDELKRREFQS